MIQLAKQDDLLGIAQLFDEVRFWMNDIKLFQWPEHYPSVGQLIKDIEAQSCYIWFENGVVMGSMCIDGNEDIQYKCIGWPRAAQKPMVLHRLAVGSQYKGRGIATKMCLFAEKYAQQHGFDSIRLDAFSKNSRSNGIYCRLGYKLARGYCYFHGHEAPFYCYEKEIN